MTINQGLELLDIIEKKEKAFEGAEGLLDIATEKAVENNKEADWLVDNLFDLKICPTAQAYKCKYQEDKDYPLSECVKCWRDSARKAVMDGALE